MQTFLTTYNLAENFRCLDRARLGKQRVEAWQILRTLCRDTDNPHLRKALELDTMPLRGNGWINHPAVKMWRGSERLLAVYGTRCCSEWLGRGYQDTMRWRFINVIGALDAAPKPTWWHDEALAASHRAALLYKDPDHYGQFGWTEKPAEPDAKGSLPYVWPVNNKEVSR